MSPSCGADRLGGRPPLSPLAGTATLAGIGPYVDEMIVVDDAGTHGTAHAAARAGAHVLRQSERGGCIAAVRHGIA